MERESTVVVLQALPTTENEITPKTDSEPKTVQFYIISGSYLLFTITDSALRMIVLFELYKRRFNVIEIAIMFTLYELVGVITNLLGGVFGTSHGLKSSLVVGLLCQLIGIAALTVLLWTDSWNPIGIICYVTAVQTFTGIAKDLVKLAGKSSTKLVKVLKGDHEDSLFKVVAWLTGAKNSVKGLGFFFGAALINYAGYWQSLLVLFILILITIPPSYYLDGTLGQSKKQVPKSLKAIFVQDASVNALSIARMFLFGSRDVWFEIILPIYLRTQYSWEYVFAGTIMATWIIFYGAVQSFTPTMILSPLKQYPVRRGVVLVPWTVALLAISAALGLFLTLYTKSDTLQLVLFLIGIYIFGFIFAVNSSIHSYLIVAYSDKDKVSMTVGFYYMSNALGRLFGTLLSGFLFFYYGLSACLWASVGMLLICTLLSTRLKDIKQD
jgi:MFS family permease